MLGLFARLFLLRFLPRRLVPFFTIYELYRMVRGRRAPAPVDQGVAQGGRARVGR